LSWADNILDKLSALILSKDSSGQFLTMRNCYRIMR